MEVCEWMRENVLLTIVLILSTLVAIGGVILFCAGIYVLASFSQYVGSFEDGGVRFYLFGIPLLVIGTVAVVAACIGFYAVYTTVNCVFIYFVVALWIVVFMEALLAGFALAETQTTQPTVSMRSACDGRMFRCLAYEMDQAFMADYDRPEMRLQSNKTTWSRPEDPVSLRFDAMHTNLKCCGSNGPSDFTVLKVPLPRSCVHNPEFIDPDGDDLGGRPHKKGCKPILVNWLRKTILVVGIIAAVFCILTVFVAILACIVVVVYVYRNKEVTCG